jgi:spore cortex formation protein SpoVR/YcgB (stage V sporulation)
MVPRYRGRRLAQGADFAMQLQGRIVIAQYLSPRLMREFHLFALAITPARRILVDSIHDDRGYCRCVSSWRNSTRRRCGFPTCRSCASIATAIVR